MFLLLSLLALLRSSAASRHSQDLMACGSRCWNAKETIVVEISDKRYERPLCGKKHASFGLLLLGKLAFLSVFLSLHSSVVQLRFRHYSFDFSFETCCYSADGVCWTR